MEKFRQLAVWQRAHELVLDVYKLTKKFPNDEKYGLVSQMRRAAISVPANIAESSKRRTTADQSHFYTMASASLEELKYYLILSTDLNLTNKETTEQLLEKARKVGAMLHYLKNSLNHAH